MALCSLAFCSVIYKEEALSNADGMHKHLLMRWRGWWRRGSEVGGPPTSKGAPFFQSFWGSTVYWYISVTWLRGYIFFFGIGEFLSRLYCDFLFKVLVERARKWRDIQSCAYYVIWSSLTTCARGSVLCLLLAQPKYLVVYWTYSTNTSRETI